MPLIVGERAETVAPGGVRCRRATAIRNAIHPRGHRMRMQPHRGGGLIEGFSEPEWTQRWHRQGCAARDKWVGLVAGNTDEMLHARVARVQIGIADGPSGPSGSRW